MKASLGVPRSKILHLVLMVVTLTASQRAVGLKLVDNIKKPINYDHLSPAEIERIKTADWEKKMQKASKISPNTACIGMLIGTGIALLCGPPGIAVLGPFVLGAVGGAALGVATPFGYKAWRHKRKFRNAPSFEDEIPGQDVCKEVEISMFLESQSERYPNGRCIYVYTQVSKGELHALFQGGYIPRGMYWVITKNSPDQQCLPATRLTTATGCAAMGPMPATILMQCPPTQL